ncbi:unnamed protein product, partial [Didymodactylos carnosus]
MQIALEVDIDIDYISCAYSVICLHTIEYKNGFAITVELVKLDDTD